MMESSVPNAVRKARAKKAGAKATRKTKEDQVLHRRSFLANTDAAAIAANMAGKKTKENTKQQYSGKVNFLREYLKNEDPEALDEEDDISIPVNDDNVLVKFFGFIMASAYARDKLQSPDDIPEDEADPWSVSQINGYKSAIVSLYTAQDLKLSDKVDTKLKGMIDGYEKLITSLKKRGLMKIGEGM
jgi:hypothetical protein